jgi:hypothetical protein
MEQLTSASSASDSSRGLMDRVREGATAQLSSQKERATDGLGALSQAVRQSTQPFRDHGQDAIAQYIEKAADQLERFSTQLRERDVNDLVDDVQQFARRQPAVFIGAAFAAGVIAARFLKSSADNRRYGGISRDRELGSRYDAAPTRFNRAGGSTQYAGGGL